MAYLELKDVNVTYGSGQHAFNVLENLNLTVEQGQFVSIVGFSGMGKTTLVNLIAGLVKPTSGTVKLNGKIIEGTGVERGLVFQNYSLFPWLTVKENVRLAVETVVHGLSAKDIDERVEKYVTMVKLDHAMNKYPRELSGGMRQRVSVARALSTSPEILLLDEPLSALDALTRAQLQDEIINIWEQEKKTMLLITNDVDEGLYMSDRILPLTIGPGANLGKDFTINLPRPRNRTELNGVQEFKQLRKDVNLFLIAENERMTKQKELEASTAVPLPEIEPIPYSKYDYQSIRAKDKIKKLGLDTDKFLHVRDLSKVYRTKTGPFVVCKNIDFDLKQGEFVSIIGHSGCGKSTLLSMLSGLNPISEGKAELGRRKIAGPGLDRGVVFQAPSLFPWMSAESNVMLGVDKAYKHATKKERLDIAHHFLERVGLGDVIKRRVSDFSNGMKQRVGIARGLAIQPKLLLLDEPFGMLDSLTRIELQGVLMDVWEKTRVTSIIVTHDVDEAILLCDRVIMMTNGPEAEIGEIMEVDLPRPRVRSELLDDDRFYNYRTRLLTFLENCEAEKVKKSA